MKLSKIAKFLIIAWFVNACVLVIGWWGGYYLLLVEKQGWVRDPLTALLWTHSIIKATLTILITVGFADKGTDYMEEKANS